jgi:hypothetical protein
LLALHGRAQAKIIASAPLDKQEELAAYLSQIRPTLSFDPARVGSGTLTYHDGNGAEFFAPNPELAAKHGLTLLPPEQAKPYQSVSLSNSQTPTHEPNPTELVDSTPAALVRSDSPTIATTQGNQDMPRPSATPVISGPTPTPQTVATVSKTPTSDIASQISGASASGVTVKPAKVDKNKSARQSHLEQVANKLISNTTRQKLDQKSVAVVPVPNNDAGAAKSEDLELSFGALSDTSFASSLASSSASSSIGSADDLLDQASSEDEGGASAKVVTKAKAVPPPVAPKPVKKLSSPPQSVQSASAASAVAPKKVVPPNPLRSTIVQDVVIPDEPSSTIDLQTALMNFTKAYLANPKSAQTRAQKGILREMGRQNVLHYHAHQNVFVHEDAVKLLQTVESTSAVAWDYRIGLALAKSDSDRAYHLANLEVALSSQRTAAKLAYGPYLQIPEQLDFIHSYHQAIGLRNESNPAVLSAQGIEKAEKAYRKLDKACVLYLNTIVGEGNARVLSQLRARERYENPILQVRLATLEDTEKRYQAQGMSPFDQEYVKIRRAITFMHAQLRFWSIAKSVLDDVHIA